MASRGHAGAHHAGYRLLIPSFTWQAFSGMHVALESRVEAVFERHSMPVPVRHPAIDESAMRWKCPRIRFGGAILKSPDMT